MTFTGPLASIAAAMARRSDPDDDLSAAAARLEAAYQQRLAKWERDAPLRAAAAAAMEAAHQRRAAELGRAGAPRVAVAAALDWMRPERPGIGG